MNNYFLIISRGDVPKSYFYFDCNFGDFDNIDYLRKELFSEIF